MLILTRKKGQSFFINDNIKITISDVGSDTVRVAIDAPREVKVLREELVQAAEMNEEAASQKNVAIADIKKVFSLPEGHDGEHE
jgi:carbon storage regulator